MEECNGKVNLINAKEIYERWFNIVMEYFRLRLFYTSPNGAKRNKPKVNLDPYNYLNLYI